MKDGSQDFKKTLRRIRAIRKRLSKIRVGLPKKVVFEYSKGIVTCYPKEKRWVIEVKEKKPITHIISNEYRNDVTKFKARHFLKLAIIGLLRNDG